MELGIGLGRMGTNMVRRLMRAGHKCVVYDRQPEVVEALAKERPIGTASLEEFAHKLKGPRALWMLSALHYQFGGHKEKAAKGSA
ncbi:MAG: NAD(P)-binding domain-containing protein [Candidatus Acidiferrales bacterium]